MATTAIARTSPSKAEVQQQVQGVAAKANDGASGARALAHVNQIAMEQARTRPGQS